MKLKRPGFDGCPAQEQQDSMVVSNSFHNALMSVICSHIPDTDYLQKHENLMTHLL